ncbi:MAG: septum formation initiator family protein [Chloroflexi bacterium]|nr:septum formation initiator family protein [Chloroflexota bacterium]
MSEGAARRSGARGGISLAQVVLLLAIPLLVLLAFSAGRKVIEMVALRQEATELRQEIDLLKARNTELRQQVEYLRSDRYVERVAREELGLVKPGDTPVVVLVPTAAATPSPTPTPTARPAIWQQIAEQFGRLVR